MMTRWAARGLLAGVVLLLAAIQVVPYGRRHTNPPERVEPPWDSPATRALAARACFDCHSHETVWPWYAHVAPISWLTQRDVDTGRRTLNFSRWDQPQKEAHEAPKVVRKGAMPPWLYTAAHAEARLSRAEVASLARGLRTTLGTRGED